MAVGNLEFKMCFPDSPIGTTVGIDARPIMLYPVLQYLYNSAVQPLDFITGKGIRLP